MSSVSDYPSEQFLTYLENNPIIQVNLNSSTVSYAQIKKNTLAVRLFFDDLSYTLLTQAPKVVGIDLMAKVGGLLGLEFFEINWS